MGGLARALTEQRVGRLRQTPFGGPKQVLKYLARYTNRVAISNQRIQSFDNGRVSFSWKDYAHGNQKRIMTLNSVEFIRRFLLHVLPTGFMRIRYYGFFANRHRAEKLQLAQKLLTDQSSSTENEHENPELPEHQTGLHRRSGKRFRHLPKVQARPARHHSPCRVFLRT